MTTKLTAIAARAEEAKNFEAIRAINIALTCLYAQVPESVAKNIQVKILPIIEKVIHSREDIELLLEVVRAYLAWKDAEDACDCEPTDWRCPHKVHAHAAAFNTSLAKLQQPEEE